jgi:ATP-dependent Clp protease adapter protein ClpS
VASLAGSGLAESLSYCLAFAALILVHELGHFAAARALGLRVFAINISGLGGSCLTQLPRDVKGTFFLYSAGLVAQAVLGVLTLAAVAVLGYPESPVGQSVYITFTVVNLVVAAINLIPGKIGDNLSTDGAILWGLLLHVVGGRPHPLARQHVASPVFPSQTRLTAVDGMVPAGFQTGVELLNDDKTPMEFVVAVLERHLKLDRESAIAAMLQIHARGGLLLPLADPAQAAEVAREVTREARDLGHPLVCRAVEASSGAGA